MKICSSCNVEKETNMFQKRKASNDGLTSRCRSCLKLYEDSRLRDPKRMEARREYQKTLTGKASHNKASQKWVKSNTIKRACHILVSNHIRDLKIIKLPCEICGSDKVNAHHDDYAHPLKIRWLCDIHHTEWHKVNGEGLNGC